MNGIRDELEGECTWHRMLDGTQALGMRLILTMLPRDATDWILCYDAMRATIEVSTYDHALTGLDGR